MLSEVQHARPGGQGSQELAHGRNFLTPRRAVGVLANLERHIAVPELAVPEAQVPPLFQRRPGRSQAGKHDGCVHVVKLLAEATPLADVEPAELCSKRLWRHTVRQAARQ